MSFCQRNINNESSLVIKSSGGCLSLYHSHIWYSHDQRSSPRQQCLLLDPKSRFWNLSRSRRRMACKQDHEQSLLRCPTEEGEHPHPRGKFESHVIYTWYWSCHWNNQWILQDFGNEQWAIINHGSTFFVDGNNQEPTLTFFKSGGKLPDAAKVTIERENETNIVKWALSTVSAPEAKLIFWW